MTLSRRSFFGALAGLPVLGHVMQRAPLPSDTPLVTSGYSQVDQMDAVALDPIWQHGTLTTTAGTGVSYYEVAHVPGYGVVMVGPSTRTS